MTLAGKTNFTCGPLPPKDGVYIIGSNVSINYHSPLSLHPGLLPLHEAVCNFPMTWIDTPATKKQKSFAESHEPEEAF